MSRIKPTPLIVADIKQVEGALAEIAALDRKLGAIESSLNESIDAAKQRAKRPCAWGYRIKRVVH